MQTVAQMLAAKEKEILQLIAAGADAVNRGLVLASAGNFSVRLDAEHFAVTASGTWFDKLTRDSFAVVDLAGKHVDGPKPSSEFKLHQCAYIARADVQVVMHLHPQTATLLATLNKPVRLLTLDHAFYVGSVGTTAFYPNGSDELAETAAAQLQKHNCVLMQHHGCTVVAETVDMAYRRALNLENAAQLTFKALQLGDTDTVFPDRHAVHA